VSTLCFAAAFLLSSPKVRRRCNASKISRLDEKLYR
jgi:hypothetical protein